MFAASVNFTLLYLCVTRRFREALKSEELRVYSLVVVGASAMIAADLIVRTGRDIGSAIENAAFQVTTLISTTGYCTEDFDLWPPVLPLYPRAGDVFRRLRGLYGGRRQGLAHRAFVQGAAA